MGAVLSEGKDATKLAATHLKKAFLAAGAANPAPAKVGAPRQ